MAVKTITNLRIFKNPDHWTKRYRLDLQYRGGSYICSQHNTKEAAEAARTRLIQKYKTATAIHDKYLGWGKANKKS